MSSDPKPVYVVHGQDGYLRRQHRLDILRTLLGTEPDELSVTWMDPTTERAEVFDALRTAPFLTARRVVIVPDADAFVSANREAIEAYLDRPASTGSLVLIVDSWPARTRLAKRVAQIGEARDCSPPPESKLPTWIARAARRRGKKIDQPAVKLLVACVGPDLARLDAEIEKLALYAAERDGITESDVSAVVANTSGPVPYALTNAISAGNVGEALEALNDMMTTRGEEFRILGLLGWYLRSRRDGKGPRGPARRSEPPARMRRRFRSLLDADLALKTGADPVTTMQMLVTELCR